MKAIAELNIRQENYTLIHQKSAKTAKLLSCLIHVVYGISHQKSKLTKVSHKAMKKQ